MKTQISEIHTTDSSLKSPEERSVSQEAIAAFVREFKDIQREIREDPNSGMRVVSSSILAPLERAAQAVVAKKKTLSSEIVEKIQNMRPEAKFDVRIPYDTGFTEGRILNVDAEGRPSNVPHVFVQHSDMADSVGTWFFVA